MADAIATIQSVQGEVYIQAADGTLRAAEVGSELLAGETLVTSASGQVTLNFDGQTAQVGANQQIDISADLSASAIINVDESEVFEQSLDDVLAELDELDTQQNSGDPATDDFLAALESGEDILDNLEATAAGSEGGGGGTDGGSSFVRLGRISESTEPNEYDFEASQEDDPSPEATELEGDNSQASDITLDGDLSNTPDGVEITGTTDAPPGTDIIVEVTDNNGDTQTTTTTVNDDGTFTAVVDQPIPPGDTDVTVTVDDGNPTPVTTTEVITAPPFGPDTTEVVITSDPTTNDSTPTITGTTDGTPGSTVTVVVTDNDGNTQTVTTSTDENGDFSVDLTTPVTEGEFTIDVTVDNPSGTPTDATFDGVIDLTNPVVTIDPQGPGNDSTPTITGTTDQPAGTPVTVVVTDGNGDTQTITGSVNDDGSFSVDVTDPLPEGEFTVDVTVTDDAGNSTTSTDTGGNVDTTNPVVTIDPQGPGNDTTPTITGTTDQPAGTPVTVVVTDGNGETQTVTGSVNDDGSFSVDVTDPLPEGEFTVDVTVTDDAGNSTTSTDTGGNVDTTNPVLTIDPQGPGNDTTPTITGTTDQPAGTPVTVVVTDGNGDTQTITGSVNDDGSFSVDVTDPLPEGEFTVDVTVTDDAGNSTTATDTGGNVDTTNPVVTIDPQGPGNDTTPTITGTTDQPAGTPVTVVVTDGNGDTQTVTGSVNDDGSFSVDVTDPLPEGEFTVDVTVTDDAGNSTTATDTGGNVDTTNPVVTIDPQGPGNDTTPTITGTTDQPAGTPVTVVVTDGNGDTQTVTGSVNDDGSFSVDVTDPLPEGEFTVDVTVTDDAGNSTTSTDTGGSVDTTNPVVNIDPQGPGNDTTPTITGTTDQPAGTPVTVVVTDGNGDTQTITGSVNDDGSFSVDVTDPLPEGEFTVDVTVTDDAGNSTTATDNGGSVDTTNPVVTIDPQGPGNDTTPTITGTTDQPAGTPVTVVVTDGNGDTQTITGSVNDDGSFSVDVTDPLPEGEFTVDVTVTDDAGNSTTATDTGGNVDTTNPVVTIDPQGPGNDTTPTITGTTDQPAGTPVTVVVTDGNGDTQTITGSVNDDGSFSVDVTDPLPEGEFTVDVTVTDDAGNSTTSTDTGGSVDTTAPVISIDPQGTGNDATPTISGTTDAPVGAVVSIAVTDADGSVQTFDAIVQSDGSYSADVPQDLANGTYNVDVQVSDEAGNQGTATDSGGNVNTNAPSLTLTPQGDTNDVTPTIAGNTDAEAGNTVTITVTDNNGAVQTFSTTVQPDGSFSADVPVDLPEGSYQVEVSVTDNDGNQAVAFDNGGEIDTTAPSLVLDPQGDTSDTTPVISGTTDAPQGAQVALVVTDSAGDTQIINATVNADGSFSADVLSPLPEGSYTVQANVTDAAGNTTNVIDSGGNIDTTAPVLSLDPQGVGNDATPVISGTSNADVGTTVTLEITDSAGNTQTVNADVQADGSFSAEVPVAMADGSYTVNATVSDAAGNTTTVTDTGGSLDTAAPALSLDPQTVTNDNTPTISGNSDAPAGSAVSLVITDANGDVQTLNAVVQPDGSFSVDVSTPLPDGSFSVEASVADSAGNVQTATESGGGVDTTAPTISLDSPGNTNDATPILTGSSDASAGTLVSIQVTDNAGAVQSVSAVVQGDGSFSVEIPTDLAQGSFSATATVSDQVGNSASASATGNVDTVAPAITLNSQGEGNDTTPQVSGNTDADAGTAVTISVTDSAGDTQTFTAVVQGDGSFSANVPAPIAEGAYQVNASVTDDAGNQTTATDSSGNLDITPPNLTIDAQGNGNDTTPTISGGSDLAVGSVVTIVVTDAASNTQTFSATVQADGSYSADVPAALPEGGYSVTVSATDNAGNSASVSDNQGNIDITGPIVSLNAQALGNDTSPEITGASDAAVGTTVTITITDGAGNVQTVTTTVQPDGSFNATPDTPLAEGNFTVQASVTDNAGNTSTAIDSSGEIDTTAPTLSLDAQTPGNDTTPTISGTTDAGSGTQVSLVVTDVNGSTQTFSATVQPDGSFSAEVPAALPEGAYTVSASVLDAAGNSASDSDNGGSIDTTGPNLSLDTQPTANDTTPLITGTTDLPAGATVSVNVTDSAGATQTFSATVQVDGSFAGSPATDLAEGAYTVSATATDAAGNTTSVTESNGVVDTTAPALSLDALTTGNDATPTLSGSTDATPGATVTLVVTDVNGDTQTISTTVQPDGSFSAEVGTPLPEGSYSVEASVADDAGNTATVTDNGGQIDLTPPLLTIDAQSTGNDTTPTVSGTTDATPGATVTITVTDSSAAVQTFTATVQANGTFSADVPAALAEGSYTVDASVADEAGNTATATDSNGEIDTTGPVISLDAQVLSNDSTPTISGTTDADIGATVSITVTDANGAQQTFNATVQPDGTFSADVPADLGEGNYTVEATVNDALGNPSSATETGGSIDTTDPIISLQAHGTTADSTPTIAGTTNAVAGSTVTISVTDASATTQTFTATVQPDGSFSADVPSAMAQGNYSVSATVTDAAGNSATATDNSGNYDPATLTIAINALGSTNDVTPTISGVTDADPGSTVSITVTDSDAASQTFTATVQPDGSFSADVPADLAEGNYSVDANVTDGSGFTGSISGVTGNIDITPPAITLDPQGLGNDSTPVITGNTDAAPGSTITLNVTDGAANTQTFTTTVAANGTFSISVPAAMAEGAYTVDASVSDSAGNTGTDNENGGVLDLTDPVVNLDALGVANDATPTISGTTDVGVGETVSITVTGSNGNVQTFTAVVQPDNSFSADVPVDLREGNYNVSASVTDSAGNTGSDTETGGVVDLTAPVVSLNVPADTNDLTPTVSGTTDADSGSTVTITVTDSLGASQTFSATVAANGAFIADVPVDMAEGVYTIDASVSDQAGNTGNAAQVGGEIDITAPIISLDAQVAGNDATPEISGNTDAEVGATVTLVVVDNAGDSQTFSATVQPDGSFSASVPVPMAEGNYSVTASVLDDAGNSGTATDNAGIVDTTPPALTLDPQGTGNDTTPTISGTTDADVGSTVSITVTDSLGNAQSFTATVQVGGIFSADVPAAMAEGAYSVDAQVADSLGNSITVTNNTGVIDITAPAISVDTVGLTNDATPTIAGTTDAAPGSTVTIVTTDSAAATQTFTATVQANGSFSVDVPANLAEGAMSVDVSVTDAAGNTGSNSATGTIDTIAPVISVDAPDDTNDTTPTISGSTDAAPGSVVSITVTDSAGTSQSFSATVNAGGTYSAAVPAEMAEGNFSADVAVSDAAGNTGTATDTGEIDTTPPILIIDPIGTVGDDTPTISGNTDLGIGTIVNVKITDANGLEYNVGAVVDVNGNWSVDAPVPLAEGNFTVEATVLDPAGNIVTVSANADVDLTGPNVTLNPIDLVNDSTPTVSGNADVALGTLISIEVTDGLGYSQTFTTTAGADGSFSADVPTALGDGDYTVNVTVLDPVGNPTIASVNATVDTTDPGITLDPIGDINDVTPVISGTSDAIGAVVNIELLDTNGDVLDLTATVLPDGTFSVPVPGTDPIPVGAFTVNASVVDPAGNLATVSTNGLIDLTLPILNLDAIGDINDVTPVISGTSDAIGAVVNIELLDTNGDVLDLTATVLPDGTFSVPVPGTDPIPVGAFTVNASVIDPAGNLATVSTNGLIDLTLPILNLDAIGDINDVTPVISGTSDAIGAVVNIELLDTNGDVLDLTATVMPDGTFSVPVPGTDPIPVGAFTVNASVVDPAGNLATVSTNGLIDLTLPVLNLNPIGDINDVTPVISGTSDAIGAVVNIELLDTNGDVLDLTATVLPDGTFSVPVPGTDPIPVGAFTVNASVVDPAGNLATVSTNGLIDLTLPVLNLNPIGDINNVTPVISGTSDAIGAVVNIELLDTNGDVLDLTATVLPDGTFSVPVPGTDPIPVGAFTVNASVIDPAGNLATISTNGLIDLTLPVLNLNPIGDINNVTPVISGTSDAIGAVVNIELLDTNGDVLDLTATVLPDGTFSVPVPGTDPIPVGAFTVNASVIDPAGNLATISTNGLIDLTLPVLNLNPIGDINNVTPVISGTSDAIGAVVNIELLDTNGDVLDLTATVLPDGTFSVPVPGTDPIPVGAFTVNASVIDPAGNLATISTNGLIDLTLPVLNLNPIGDINNVTPVISGTSDAIGAVVNIELLDTNGDVLDLTATVLPDGTFSVPVPGTDPIPVGAFTVNASVIDPAGNLATISTNGLIDLTLPVLNLNPIGDINNVTPVISGTSDAIGAVVNIELLDTNGDVLDLTATVLPDGTFSVPVPGTDPIPVGAFTVNASVVDPAGNLATISTNGLIDLTLPILNLNSLDPTNNQTPTITGTSDAVGATVVVDITDINGTVSTLTGIVLPDNTFSVTLGSNLPEGAFTVDARVEDDAGNQTSTSTGGLIDITPPAFEITSLPSLLNPVISGTTDPSMAGAIVSLEVTASILGLETTISLNATVDNDGNWQTINILNLDLGLVSVNASITDLAGNVASDSGSTMLLGLFKQQEQSDADVAATGDSAPVIAGIESEGTDKIDLGGVKVTNMDAETVGLTGQSAPLDLIPSVSADSVDLSGVLGDEPKASETKTIDQSVSSSETDKPSSSHTHVDNALSPEEQQLVKKLLENGPPKFDD